MASLIVEEMSLGDMMTLLKLRRGRYSLVEETIPPGAKAIGQAIKDVQFPEQCVIAAIIRNGEIVVPCGITTFEAADEVLAVTDHAGASSWPHCSRRSGNTGFFLLAQHGALRYTEAAIPVACSARANGQPDLSLACDRDAIQPLEVMRQNARPSSSLS